MLHSRDEATTTTTSKGGGSTTTNEAPAIARNFLGIALEDRQ